MTTWILIAFFASLVAVIAWFVPRLRVGMLALGGYGLLYVGQRLLAGGDLSTPVSFAGLALVFGAVGARALALGRTGDTQKSSERGALTWQLVGVGSLALYALTLPSVTGALGLGDEGLRRWSVSFQALWPIFWLVGILPMIALDLALSNHPRRMPEGARRYAVEAGLALALATALIFPINYLAAEHDVEWDFSYFRVTAPGGASTALVKSVDKPVEVLLFFPVASDVKEKLLPYFNELAGASDGKLTVRTIDQPMEPKLSEELAVRDNGFVVLRQEREPGADGKPTFANEKFKIDVDLDKAKKDLKKLDETFQKHLIKLAKGKRTAYMLTGHGEASPRDENPQLKLGEMKNLLRAQNYEVKDFGIDQGSTTAVPDDAALVIVPAPEKALLPEETAVLKRYIDKGGAILIYVDQGRDPLVDLLGHIGLKAGTNLIANATKFAALDGGVTDHYNIVSTKFGTHASVATLSKYATRTFVAALGAVSLTETNQAAAPSPVKATPLIRTFEDSWEDLDGDAVLSAGEAKATFVIAEAVEGPETAKFRAVVVGDVSTASDFVIQHSQGDAQFLVDASRWLIGEEDLAGETVSEEDVRIEHSHEDDQLWFYGTVFGVPLLVLLAGVAFVRLRMK